MKDKELYHQTKQAELHEYEAKLEELKVHLSDEDVELTKKIKMAQSKLKEAKEKLVAFEKANLEDIDTHKKEIDDSFISLNIHLAMS